MGVLGGLFFLMTALYIAQDRKDAQLLISGNDNRHRGEKKKKNSN